MKKIFVLLFGICLLTTGCFATKVDEVEDEVVEEAVVERMTYDDLNKIVNNYSDYVNVDVIDARSEEEFEEGHIIGSINIPYNHFYEINISTDREIVVYSTTTSKSKQAAKELMDLGYTNVKYITGINNWPYDLED